MKVYHKFKNNELPVYKKNWPLITNNEIHQYNTRLASDLHTFRYHHTFARKSLRHYLVQTIHNTPDNVFSKFGTHSLNGFSNYVKLHFINNIKMDVISQIATYVLEYSQFKMQYHTIPLANIHTHKQTYTCRDDRTHTPTHATRTRTHAHDSQTTPAQTVHTLLK